MFSRISYKKKTFCVPFMNITSYIRMLSTNTEQSIEKQVMLSINTIIGFQHKNKCTACNCYFVIDIRVKRFFLLFINIEE